MGVFLRKLWKNRPKQWGPFKAVQNGLFHYTEMMGTDPMGLELAMIMWNAGDQQDYSKNGIVGTDYGTTFEGGGLYFNGSSNYINVPSFGSLFDGSNDFSIFALFRTPDVATGGTIFHPRQDYDCIIYISSLLYFYYYDGVSKGVSCSIDTAINDCVGVWESGISMRLYKNGIFQASAATGTPNATTDLNMIGVQTTSTYQRYWLGDINQFVIFSSILTPDQIAFLHDNPYYLWQPLSPVFYSLPAAGEIITLGNSSILYTGQALGIKADESIPITPSSLLYTAQPLGLNAEELVSLGAASLLCTGYPLFINEAIIIDSAGVVYAGQVITTSIDVVVAISEAQMLYAGQGLNINETLILENSSILYSGKSITVTDGTVTIGGRRKWLTIYTKRR